MVFSIDMMPTIPIASTLKPIPCMIRSLYRLGIPALKIMPIIPQTTIVTAFTIAPIESLVSILKLCGSFHLLSCYMLTILTVYKQESNLFSMLPRQNCIKRKKTYGANHTSQVYFIGYFLRNTTVP